MALKNMDRSEITDVLNNPYMGWAPWAEWGPYPQAHKLVYAQIPWSEMEPTKYNFDWNALETRLKFSYWIGRNIRIILRVYLDQPDGSSHKDIPEWLYSEINQEGTWYSGGFSPNYKNTALITNHQRMITALAQRYNSNPGIAFVELGSLGHWGEFHTVYLSSQDQGYMPPISISDQYVQHYINAFTNKILLMRRPFQIAKDNHLGLYNDMFGNPTETQRYIDYFTSGYSNPGDYGQAAGTYPAMPDFWKYAPSGGEFGDAPGLQYLADSTIQRTIQQAVDSHTSWLGPACPADQAVGSSLQSNMNSLLNTMGYRFILQSSSYTTSVNPGTTLNVTMQWNNKGVAPFYYKWPLELSLSDSNGTITVKSNTSEDIRSWLPGTKTVTQALSIPQNISAGTYTLCVAIFDPDTNTPGVDFAMTGRRSDGRYSIGQVIVSGSIPDPSPVISNIAASSITSGSAIITWTTNKAADSQVEYGTTSSYGNSTALFTSLVLTHSVSLTGLLASTTYYFRVKSRDANGSLTVSAMNSFNTQPAPVTAPITIDGNASDWNNIAPISQTSCVASLKVTNDSSKLYICVQGNGLNIKGQVFFNTDANSTSGYKVSGWNASGCEYLLEDNHLYRYTGNGTSWSWSQLGSMEFARNNTVIEAAIPLSSMKLTRGSTTRLGFILNDSPTLRLPLSSQSLVSYTIK